MKKNIGIFNLLACCAMFVLLDYVSKQWAIENLFNQLKSIEITSFLSMTPVWNSGISFGFFQNSGDIGRYFFTIFALAVSIWLILSSFKLPSLCRIRFYFNCKCPWEMLLIG